MVDGCVSEAGKCSMVMWKLQLTSVGREFFTNGAKSTPGRVAARL